MMQAYWDLYLMGEAVARKRIRAMQKNGERGSSGGPSLETLVLLALGVTAALGLGAFIVVKITSKESSVNP